MKLTRETLERLSMVITHPKQRVDFIETPSKDLIKFNMIDLNDSYFTNNFEDEVFYNGENDKNRNFTIMVDIKKECIGYYSKGENYHNSFISQYHNFDSYVKDNKHEVREDIISTFNTLKSMFL